MRLCASFVLVSSFGLSTSFLAASISSTPMQPSSSAVESDAATEHIQCGSTLEALPGNGAALADVAITSIDDVVSKLALEHGESAIVLCNAARTLQKRVQAQVRSLCVPWGVQLTEKKASGKYGKRADDILIKELTAVFIEKAREHYRTKASQSQPHTSVSVATERANVEFSIEDAMAEALHRVKSVGGDIEILARVVDHACHSQQCISHRVATMCGEAKWKISTDLCNDQPLDACGYIAADAVCRLREAALAEANGWHRTTLPDYAQQECIDRGNKVLRKRGLDRILEADEVNRLVRHYSHLDQRSQAAEEWWAGAVALDNFLTGLPDMVAELATANLGQRHRWRAWIVNTQHSEQLGSHWFTVVVGAAVGNVPQLLQSTASSSAVRRVPELSQSHASSSAAGREPHDSIGSVRSDQASFPIESEANAARLNNYQNLFDSPGAAIDLITWARAHTTYPGVSAWLEACSQWDAAVVSKEHLVQTKRRKLCKKHGIPLTKVIDTNATVEAAMEQVRRKLLAQIQEIQSQRQLPRVLGTGAV